MLIIDIDHFKRVNDSFGNIVGDRLIVGIAGSIRSGLRAGDPLDRIGGEEFVAMIEAGNLADALGISERIRLDIAEPTCTVESTIIGRVTVSIGITRACQGSTFASL